jgi:uncharacterized membrane protein (DUF4010 family)
MFEFLDGRIAGYAVALGVGLLVGAERERRKGRGPDRNALGIRSFAIVALTGVVVASLASPLLLGVAALGVVALALAGYLRSVSADPGVTTEISWVLTFMLGVLANEEPSLAAAFGALLALLLISRSWLHQLVRDRLTERETLDVVLLAAAALIALPLLPDRTVDPWGTLNPQLIGRLTVIVLLINALGYVALRIFGSRIGLPLTGFLGGFVSSTATIASLAKTFRATPRSELHAVAGAALSSVPTVLLLAAILLASNPLLLARLWPALAAAGAVAVVSAALFMWRARATQTPAVVNIGRAFDLRHAVTVAGMMTLVLAAGGWLGNAFGETGALAGIMASGFADVHAAVASAAALLRGQHLTVEAAEIAVAGAFAANTTAKLVAAGFVGGRRYALRLAPGLMLMLAAFIGLAWPR